MIGSRLVRALARPLTVGDAIVDGPGRFEPRDAIVILGAPLGPDGRPGPVVAERLAVGLALWRGGGAPRLVVTGGRTRGADRAEAIAMAEVLVAAGVPEAAILVEDAAQSTRDNARRVRALAPELHRVWLATQRFHSRRAARCFRAHGFAPRVAYWRDGLERDPRRALRWTAREYAAWLRALTRR